MPDIFDLFGVPEPAPEVHRTLRELVYAVEDLPGDDFRRAPDLTRVAMALESLLEAAGQPRAAQMAARWAYYEASGRKASAIEEARARADALYRLDLEATQRGWEPVQRSAESVLPWRQPD